MPYLLLISLVVFVAYTSPVFATRNVSGPSVDAGELKYEFRNAIELDDRTSQDERIRQLFFIDYGVTDWLAFRSTAKWDKREGQEQHLSALDMDARIEWIEHRDAGWSLGSRFTYSHQKLGNANDSVAIQTLAEQKSEEWLFRGNLIFSHETGAGAATGPEMDMSTEILYDIAPQLSIGGEWFGGFGNLHMQHGYSSQQHMVGPVSLWKLTPDTQLEISLLKGVSYNAPDAAIQCFIRGNF